MSVGRTNGIYKYSGPFLLTKVIGPVNVLLQRQKRQRPFCVHIDKIKPYVAEVMPKSWLETEVVVPDSGDRQETSELGEAAAPEDSIWAEGEGCSDMTAIARAPLGYSERLDQSELSAAQGDISIEMAWHDWHGMHKTS